MQYPKTDTGSPSPWWDKEEQTESANVPLMTGTKVSHNFGILASKDNPISSVKVCGNRNISSTLVG